MTTKEAVMASLNTIAVPGIPRSVVEMNLVRDIAINDHRVDVKLAAAAINKDTQDALKSQIEKLWGKLDGVTSIGVTFEEIGPIGVNNITNVIAIMSGKGGVGKSLVSGLTAIALRRQGFSVGILDADITGPSIPKMFGLNKIPEGSDNGFLPVISKTGIEVMSLNLLLPDENEAVIWRGPVIGKAIAQFWEEVLWGQLDYLIIDLPPGTADAPLTVLQRLPVAGIIIVSSPQNLATMIVKKAVSMAKLMNKTIIGVVENMSYLYVREIDKKIELFGSSKGQEMARAAGAPLIAQIPIDPELARLCDQGDIESYSSQDIERLGKFIAKTELNFPEGSLECKSCGNKCSH